MLLEQIGVSTSQQLDRRLATGTAGSEAVAERLAVQIVTIRLLEEGSNEVDRAAQDRSQ